MIVGASFDREKSAVNYYIGLWMMPEQELDENSPCITG